MNPHLEESDFCRETKFKETLPLMGSELYIAFDFCFKFFALCDPTYSNLKKNMAAFSCFLSFFTKFFYYTCFCHPEYFCGQQRVGELLKLD